MSPISDLLFDLIFLFTIFFFGCCSKFEIDIDINNTNILVL